MNPAGVFQQQRIHRPKASATTGLQRIQTLRKLKALILENRDRLKKAVQQDLGRHEAETDIVDITPVLHEIDFVISNLQSWMQVREVPTPVTLMGTQSEVHFEARGNCLIISPWNYPVSLFLTPLVSAIAAGNTAILKPSEKTPQVSQVLTDIINKNFPTEYIHSFEGGVEVSQTLLKLPFDHIFFTGSTAVGKIIMKSAAEHLASVTLELGGKSPAILDPQSDVEKAAKNICWGKFVNSGQTCIAPDYVYVHESQKEKFLAAFKKHIKQNSYQMVDSNTVKRLQKLVQDSLSAGAQLACGGDFNVDQKRISPTILTNVNWQHAIMQEEIFGPILPILTYSSVHNVIGDIQRFDKPLALYIFSNNEEFQHTLLNSISSGGVCINNTLLHFANPHLPFGGVGASGMGRYHGEYGFREFSHEKSVLKQSRMNLSQMIHPPYDTRKFKFFSNFMKRFL